MTWTGILDLPLSLAALICETAECGWDELDPERNPSHLAAILAGARSHATGQSFDAALVAVAATSLGEALNLLEVEGGAD